MAKKNVEEGYYPSSGFKSGRLNIRGYQPGCQSINGYRPEKSKTPTTPPKTGSIIIKSKKEHK